MKSFIIATLISALTINLSFASVSSDVSLLGDLAMGANQTAVKGRSAEEMLKAFFVNETGDSDIVLTFKEIEEMSFGDEVGMGFTSFRSAKGMGEFAEGQLNDQLEGIDNKIEAAKMKNKILNLKSKWAPTIERLARAGAKFGYSGNGPGYCGVSFIKLIIVDPNTSKVYEVYLSESGEC